LLYPDETGLVLGFGEKPMTGRNDFASIGACLFNWETLRRYLTPEFVRERSTASFGMDIFPAMLSSSSESVYAYRLNSYWRNVETLENLWESNMDLLGSHPCVLNEGGRKVYSSTGTLSSYSPQASDRVSRSMLSGSHVILGRVDRSVLSDSVFIGEGAEVTDSIIMPNVYIGNNVKIHKTIVGSRSHILDGAEIGVENGASDFVSDRFCRNGVSLIASWVSVGEKTKLQKNSYLQNGLCVDITTLQG
jgi:glucose-1-phosphate adenylyltransferase